MDLEFACTDHALRHGPTVPYWSRYLIYVVYVSHLVRGVTKGSLLLA